MLAVKIVLGIVILINMLIFFHNGNMKNLIAAYFAMFVLILIFFFFRKENNMKATDLMIGDWVSVHFGEPNETIGNDMYGPVAELYDDGRIEVAFKDSPSILWNIEKERGDEILPIPITPEILEKNGWVLDEIDGSYRHPDLGFWIGGRSAPFGFMVSSTYKDLYYVHELQHALRLCGIDKEIVL